MEFEWSEEKNAENLQKHGISFEEAGSLWDGFHVEVENIARSEEGETRSATIGWMRDKIFVAIWTARSGRIRLISVRRARKNEEKIFHEKIQDDIRNG